MSKNFDYPPIRDLHHTGIIIFLSNVRDPIPLSHPFGALHLVCCCRLEELFVNFRFGMFPAVCVGVAKVGFIFILPNLF